MMALPWNWHRNRPADPIRPAGRLHLFAHCAKNRQRLAGHGGRHPAPVFLPSPTVLSTASGENRHGVLDAGMRYKGLKCGIFSGRKSKPAKRRRAWPAASAAPLAHLCTVRSRRPRGVAVSPPGSRCPSSAPRDRGRNRRTGTGRRPAAGRRRRSPRCFLRRRSAWCGR